MAGISIFIFSWIKQEPSVNKVLISPFIDILRSDFQDNMIVLCEVPDYVKLAA